MNDQEDFDPATSEAGVTATDYVLAWMTPCFGAFVTFALFLVVPTLVTAVPQNSQMFVSIVLHVTVAVLAVVTIAFAIPVPGFLREEKRKWQDFLDQYNKEKAKGL